MKIKFRNFFILPLLKKVILVLALFIANATALNASILRDSETEEVFKLLSAPLKKAIFKVNNSADKNSFDKSSFSKNSFIKNPKINFRLFLDNNFNAFVVDSSSIYFTTEMILNLTNASQFIAISAHEMAHIKSLHIAQLKSTIDKSASITLTAAALGIASALATKNSAAAVSGVLLGAQLGKDELLSSIRNNEMVADSVALNAFKEAKMSPIGQVQVQKKLLDKSGYISKTEQFNQTHPPSEYRLNVARQFLKKSPYKNKSFPAKSDKAFRRIQAKLFGFLKSRQQVFTKYPNADNSDLALYARANYYLANNKAKKGLTQIRTLLDRFPNDGYYKESYAVLLFATGSYKAAIKNYREVLKQFPKSGLFHMQYAMMLIEIGDKKSLKQAEYALYKAKLYEPDNISLYRLMVALYSKTKNEALRLLARSEEYYLKGDLKAVSLARQSMRLLKKNSSQYKRADDIIALMIAKRQRQTN